MEISPEVYEAFKRNYLVAGLSDEAIAEVFALVEVVEVRRGETIIEKGQKASDLFVILAGRANVYTPHGEKLHALDPGSVVGEVALVDNGPRSANVTALEQTLVGKLPAAALRAHIGKNKEVGFLMLVNLSQVLARRLRSANEIVEDLSGKKVDPWFYAT